MNKLKILFYKIFDKNKYREVQWEIERVKYAINNPWVFDYNFGHKELLNKYLKF